MYFTTAHNIRVLTDTDLYILSILFIYVFYKLLYSKVYVE
jgi:hypothetical protein